MLATVRNMWTDTIPVPPQQPSTIHLSANVAVTSRTAGVSTITATFHQDGQRQDPDQLDLTNATIVRDSIGQYHATVPDGTVTVWNYQQACLQVDANP